MIKTIKALIPNKYKRNVKLFFIAVSDSVKYYIARGGMFPKSKINNIADIKRIIFVCKGNVCRSVFAEYRFKQLLNNFEIVSCGLDADQGTYPPSDSVSVCDLYSCDVKNHVSLNHRKINFQGSDLIFAMEYWHYVRLVNHYPDIKDNIFLLRSISRLPSSINCNIADPYGLGIDEFKKSYKIIDQALGELVRLIPDH
ncbi:MAG: hypothetical protein ABW098_04000 [Candidatus Thiodiazotropha sp.]